MSVLRIKNQVTGKWEVVPFVNNSGGGSNITAGENINVEYLEDSIEISAVVPDISNLATKAEVATKQEKGDYALASDIPNLTDYIKNTDIATSTTNGIVKANGSGGIKVNSAGNISTVKASESDIDAKTNENKVIVPNNLNYAVNSVLPTMTQAEYDALETKDENLFYMIVEG